MTANTSALTVLGMTPNEAYSVTITGEASDNEPEYDYVI